MHLSAEKIHRSLPIFRYCRDDKCIIYTPGHYSQVSKAYSDILKSLYACPHNNRNSDFSESILDFSNTFIQHAETATYKWNQWVAGKYTPKCLTVYLSNHCNLDCEYCYSKTDTRTTPIQVLDKPPVISMPSLKYAAGTVANNCQRNNKPFNLVIHGGGEPTLHWSTLLNTVALTKQVAAEYDIAWFGYIATNGMLGSKNAKWISKNLDRVGLSCDGPPDIQDKQRPRLGGGATSRKIEQTAEIFRSGKTALSVRATITPESCHRQIEIVEYLATRLGASEISFEPSYKKNQFKKQQASDFVEYYTAARQRARELHCRLFISGVRPDEFHGPFCNIQKNVLQITPEGFISACFKNNRGYQDNLLIGNITDHHIEFNNRRISQIQGELQTPVECEDCINIYHCSRNCPESCPISCRAEAWTGGFRCIINKLLMYNELDSLLS